MFALLHFLAAATAPSPAGAWTSPTGSITIQISQCPNNAAQWCGTVTAASAKAVADTAKASGRDLVGMMLVRDMRRVAPNHWRGWIEVPDKKVTAKGAIRLIGNDVLEVKGCGLGGVVCKKQRWRRVD